MVFQRNTGQYDAQPCRMGEERYEYDTVCMYCINVEWMMGSDKKGRSLLVKCMYARVMKEKCTCIRVERKAY